MKIILPKERPISLNRYYAGMHWTERKQEVDRVHALVKYSIPINQRKLFTSKVDISLTAFFANKPMDSSNIVAKIYEDAVKGILIVDDTPQYVGFVTTKSEINIESPRVELEIVEENTSLVLNKPPVYILRTQSVTTPGKYYYLKIDSASHRSISCTCPAYLMTKVTLYDCKHIRAFNETYLPADKEVVNDR